MSELGSIFNPGEAEMTQHLSSEKVLPAPAAVPGDPIRDEDGSDVIIPPILPAAAVIPEPVRVKRPEELEELEDERH